MKEGKEREKEKKRERKRKNRERKKEKEKKERKDDRKERTSRLLTDPGVLIREYTLREIIKSLPYRATSA